MRFRRRRPCFARVRAPGSHPALITPYAPLVALVSNDDGLIDFQEFKYMLTSPDVIKGLATPRTAPNGRP